MLTGEEADVLSDLVTEPFSDWLRCYMNRTYQTSVDALRINRLKGGSVLSGDLLCGSSD